MCDGVDKGFPEFITEMNFALTRVQSSNGCSQLTAHPPDVSAKLGQLWLNFFWRSVFPTQTLWLNFTTHPLYPESTGWKQLPIVYGDRFNCNKLEWLLLQYLLGSRGLFLAHIGMQCLLLNADLLLDYTLSSTDELGSSHVYVSRTKVSKRRAGRGKQYQHAVKYVQFKLNTMGLGHCQAAQAGGPKYRSEGISPKNGFLKWLSSLPTLVVHYGFK
ncbi:hypothetical protein C8R44DRAFT_901513 [Mycena epipterygia]|nr:hypothetical protein C8R44DRAFT_901513 [Mycena epipterygia]